MRLPFYKYHGTGNDFIVIDHIHHPNPNLLIPYTPVLIQKLCDRKFGIGADGLILLQKSATYDFEMVYYNPDGSQSFCGNGSRCAVHLAHQLGIIQSITTFLAIDGSHTAHVQGNLVNLQLHPVTSITRIGEDYFVNTGSPHYICLVENLATLNIINPAKAINARESFQKQGTNVNFVQLGKDNTIAIRTYERGVNQETLSCGTGAAAAALVASQKGYISPISIQTAGGTLQVSFNKNRTIFTEICLIGPATQVFQGQMSLDNLIGTS